MSKKDKIIKDISDQIMLGKDKIWIRSPTSVEMFCLLGPYSNINYGCTKLIIKANNRGNHVLCNCALHSVIWKYQSLKKWVLGTYKKIYW